MAKRNGQAGGFEAAAARIDAVIIAITRGGPVGGDFEQMRIVCEKAVALIAALEARASKTPAAECMRLYPRIVGLRASLGIATKMGAEIVTQRVKGTVAA